MSLIKKTQYELRFLIYIFLLKRKLENTFVPSRNY